MAGRQRAVLGLIALVGIVLTASVWQDAYRVGGFCDALERGEPMDPVAASAWEAGSETWSLPATTWRGVRQPPIFVVQEGHFICAVMVDDGRVVNTHKWFDRAFHERYPRRLARAGRL